MKNFLIEVGWQHSFLMSALCVPTWLASGWSSCMSPRILLIHFGKEWKNLFYKGFKSFKVILFQNESTPSKLKLFSLKKILLFFTLLGSKLQNKIHIKIKGDVLGYFLIKQDFLFTVLELAVGLCFPHLEK